MPAAARKRPAARPKLLPRKRPAEAPADAAAAAAREDNQEPVPKPKKAPQKRTAAGKAKEKARSAARSKTGEEKARKAACAKTDEEKTRKAGPKEKARTAARDRATENASRKAARTSEAAKAARREKYAADAPARAAKRRRVELQPAEIPATTLELLHNIHSESGFSISANSEQLQRLHKAGVPPEAPHYQSLVAAVRKDIQENCEITSEDLQRIIADYGERMDPLRPLLACASCGVRDPSRPTPTPCCLSELAADHWLRYSAEEVAELEAMPTVTLLTETGAQRQVHLKLLCSFYCTGDGKLYHVHPELVEVDAESGTLTVHLCEKCHKAAGSESGRAPQDSIAGGCDYGLLSRLGIELPSALETLGLADVRNYSLTVKVHVPGQ